MAALNDKYPGLGDEIFPIKLCKIMRSIVEASAHMFEDAAALDTLESRSANAQLQPASTPTSTRPLSRR